MHEYLTRECSLMSAKLKASRDGVNRKEFSGRHSAAPITEHMQNTSPNILPAARIILCKIFSKLEKEIL